MTALIRVRFLMREVDERCGLRDFELLSVSATRGVIPRFEVTTKEPRADDLSNYKICRTGDIVVNRMSAYQGALGLARQDGIVSPDYIVFRPTSGVEPRWLQYVMRSAPFVSEMAARIRGIGSIGTGNVRSPRVSAGEIGDISVACPSLVRQRAIAEYLDTETTRLDALIAKQGQSIALLEEQLSARVHFMLSHWPRVPLKRLVDPSRPITYGIIQAGPPVDGGVPYIRPIDMDGHDGVRDVAGLLTTTPDIAESYRRSRVRQGDLVVSIGPSFGKTMVVPPELSGANLTQGTARVAPAVGVDVRFLRWALRSKAAVDHWEASVGGATFRALNLAPLATTPVPDMPLNEQTAAADRLDREEQWSHDLVVAKRALIDLLKERKETLIVRAVSGDLKNVGAA